MDALYEPGTDKGVGWKPSHLKPEFFGKQEEAKEIAIAFNQEANKLAEEAATGNIETIKDQFGKVGKTCKSCHDNFRIRDK